MAEGKEMTAGKLGPDAGLETPNHQYSASGTTLDEQPPQHSDGASSDLGQGVDAEIYALARRFTTQSMRSGHGPLFPLADGGPLDPNSDSFNARKWAKAYYTSRTAASEGNKPRTTGIAFKNLDVYGFNTPTDFQKTIANVALEGGSLFRKMTGYKGERIDILQDVEGVVHPGEMLCVLGPPGSGCSTLLRTIAGDTYGFHVNEKATINYSGVRPEQMKMAYRGEAIYTAEVDHHFPHLTVGDTLYFAARSRCPPKANIPNNLSRREYAEHLRDVLMAMFGISHTKNTRVGNDFVRGVSGGERKRVTIAEAALGFSPLQCWDNSTRGLDSANAVEFCRVLKTQADILGITSCVAIYQAPQTAYDVFDKVIVLFEGRQIYFGRADEAKAYFEGLGFICPEQQTTPDFLTSMTNPAERIVRPGFNPPQTASEFAEAWKASQHRSLLLDEIDRYIDHHPFDGVHHERFFESRRMDQSPMQRPHSPFNLSYLEQLSITLWRAWVLLKNDPSITLTLLVSNLFEALIISSLFYNLPANTTSFFRRTILLFFIVLMNAFASILEIMTLYTKRKVVEKQARYAFYHPSAEALSAIVMDLPYKIVNAIILNGILYFMCNLRREPGPFFFFLLISFTLTLTMSMLFRFIGSITKTIAQALAPASIILLALILYTGFTIPVAYMQVWLGWIRWINPVFYGLESVFLNEFIGRQFPCSDIVPSGPGYAMGSLGPAQMVCNVPGSVAGQSYVEGGNYLQTSFGFVNSHRWRNFGVLIAFMVLFMGLHLFATEYISSERSKGEVLVFIRDALRKRSRGKADVETGKASSARSRQRMESPDGTNRFETQTSTFHWNDVCYDIKIKGEPRRILDNVDGWVKPGTLTALMGVSGAGKTTLLDVLASRVTMGVVSGEMLVDGRQRDSSFQRKTGYVTQQDLHLATSTVREALMFSALLRQPAKYSKQEKIAYVETIIDLLNMSEYSNAIIGIPGEGLNVEQRKRLTIGVELVARPQLLLFLDEPTSGLDSQTSWSICDLMETLTKNGQAILCTIHQPSAMLFQRFDRLLLLAKGGKTVYFGEVGTNSTVLMDYFVCNGGPPLPEGVNPAEHMLEVIGAAPGAHTDIDWPETWRKSPEYRGVQDELSRLRSNEKRRASAATDSADPSVYREFAAPFTVQVAQVTKRVFQQYWRSPAYIFSKFALSAGAALFIGLSILNMSNTARGLQNQMFGVFMFLSIFGQISEQLMPIFCEQRTLYEARERPSKSYSWQSFMLANITIEMFWNSLMSVICFICWYYPIGLYRNAEWTDEVNIRGFCTFLLVWAFFLLASSFGHLLIAGTPNPDIAGGIQNLLFIMMFAFCGILAGPDQLPGFWIFMYRVNPFTYVVDGFMGAALANAPVNCAPNEIMTIQPAGNGSITCTEYMMDYMSARGGQLVGGSGQSTEECHYCQLSDTNAFLAGINVNFDNRWRNFGLLWVYIVFNTAAAVFLYWLVRVPKKNKVKKE